MPVYNTNTLADLNTSCTFKTVALNYVRNNQCSTYGSNMSYCLFACTTGWECDTSWCAYTGWGWHCHTGKFYSVNCNLKYCCITSNSAYFAEESAYSGQTCMQQFTRIETCDLLTALPSSNECFNVTLTLGAMGGGTAYRYTCLCNYVYVGSLLVANAYCACCPTGSPYTGVMTCIYNIEFQCIGSNCWEVFCNTGSVGCVSTTDVLDCFRTYICSKTTVSSGERSCGYTSTALTCVGTSDSNVCILRCIPDGNILFCENKFLNTGNATVLGNYIYQDVSAVNRVSPIGPATYCTDGAMKCYLNYAGCIPYSANESVGFAIANKQRSTSALTGICIANGFYVPYSNYNAACISVCRLITC